MKAKLSTTLFSASLCAVGIATAHAAPPGTLGGDAAPQAWERCQQEPACRDGTRARFDARFKRLDADGDGGVSKAEAEKGAPHLAEHFAEIDANQDGKLTPDEMRSAMSVRRAHCKQDPERCRTEMKQRFESAWKRADTDGDGMLSRLEAEQGLPRLARHFDRVDTDRDGRITLAEVEAARARHPHPRQAPQPDATSSSTPQGG